MEEIILDITRRLNAAESLRTILINNKKSYRSSKVSFQNGYITACKEILDYINKPERDEQIRQAVQSIAERLSS